MCNLFIFLPHVEFFLFFITQTERAFTDRIPILPRPMDGEGNKCALVYRVRIYKRKEAGRTKINNNRKTATRSYSLYVHHACTRNVEYRQCELRSKCLTIKFLSMVLFFLSIELFLFI